jgi:hypothetical protein
MAISATFYLDSPSLSSATVIYADANLTVPATNGFYSDGTIVREQLSGVLLPQVVCPSCAIPCGGTIAASGSQGVYTLNTSLGINTGAVIVRFNPFLIPDGIIAVYDSSYYNGLSSPVYGWLQAASSSLPTYIGDSTYNCNIVGTSPHTLPVYNYTGASFVATGGTETFSVIGSQLDLTTNPPGICVMVIPKTAASPSTLALKFYGPCTSTTFDISVTCPTVLPSFLSSTVGASSSAACSDTIDQTYYVAYVNGGAGILGLYDLVFSDQNGEFKLGAGYYLTTAAGSYNWFRVDSNGVIIGFGNCSIASCECHDGIINTNGRYSFYDCDGILFAGGAELNSEICYNINAPHSANITNVGPAVSCTCGTPPPVSYNCIDGDCINPGDGTGTYDTVFDCRANCSGIPETYNCVDGACEDPGDGSGTYSTIGACLTACGVTPSYNCVSGNCIDPGNGTGTYSTLIACQNNCTPPPVTYNCVSGTCIDPGDGSGTYSTLSACQADCTIPPPVTYNCVSGTCIDPGDGSGTYTTLSACLSACGVVESYNCGPHFICYDPGDGTGTYSTLSACEADCTYFTSTYDCVDGTCVDPGDGTGAYADLASCIDSGCQNAWECLGNPLGCVNVGSFGSYTSEAECLGDGCGG